MFATPAQRDLYCVNELSASACTVGGKLTVKCNTKSPLQCALHGFPVPQYSSGVKQSAGHHSYTHFHCCHHHLRGRMQLWRKTHCRQHEIDTTLSLTHSLRNEGQHQMHPRQWLQSWVQARRPAMAALPVASIMDGCNFDVLSTYVSYSEICKYEVHLTPRARCTTGKVKHRCIISNFKVIELVVPGQVR